MLSVQNYTLSMLFVTVSNVTVNKCLLNSNFMATFVPFKTNTFKLTKFLVVHSKLCTTAVIKFHMTDIFPLPSHFHCPKLLLHVTQVHSNPFLNYGNIFTTFHTQTLLREIRCKNFTNLISSLFASLPSCCVDEQIKLQKLSSL